jgi:2-polyprenyl-3-methyl-5-hydroxy-6-metoxy-1,4-benzoquinol methylase
VAPACRHCGTPLHRTFVDIGMSPLCENFLPADRLDEMEAFYPLNVRICEQCLLVQLPAYVGSAEIFDEYAYFSSFSDSYVEHAGRYVTMIAERLGLGPDSLVIEVASNDGYLLDHVIRRGIRALGIEPAANVAKAAVARGVPTVVEYVGVDTATAIAAEHGRADLVIANNVFAHVPDIHDFTRGLAALLKPGGTLTIEVQHIARMIERNQFDTIYHEHFSYYTLLTAKQILEADGLRVIDVDEITTHGGSMRIYAAHAHDPREADPRVAALIAWERSLGYDTLEGFDGFAERVEVIKRDLLAFLIQAQRDGATVAGYGAPGKGNTLLNYCGIREDLLSYIVDRNPYKHGRYTPGTHIPIFPPEHLAETRPDYILILPWNLRTEILEQLAYAREWGAKFVVPIPSLEVLP